nr:uncharacterized protein LOC104086138 isoform X2 [Nicotiana tomentosiformis]
MVPKSVLIGMTIFLVFNMRFYLLNTRLDFLVSKIHLSPRDFTQIIPLDYPPKQEFDMKPSKNENEVASTLKAATKYAFVAPGAIGKGRRRGLKSLSSLGVSRTDIPFFPSTDQVMQYNQIVETTKGRGRGLRSMQTDISFSPYVNQVMQSTQKVETSMVFSFYRSSYAVHPNS